MQFNSYTSQNRIKRPGMFPFTHVILNDSHWHTDSIVRSFIFLISQLVRPSFLYKYSSSFLGFLHLCSLHTPTPPSCTDEQTFFYNLRMIHSYKKTIAIHKCLPDIFESSFFCFKVDTLYYTLLSIYFLCFHHKQRLNI